MCKPEHTVFAHDKCRTNRVTVCLYCHPIKLPRTMVESNYTPRSCASTGSVCTLCSTISKDRHKVLHLTRITHLQRQTAGRSDWIAFSFSRRLSKKLKMDNDTATITPYFAAFCGLVGYHSATAPPPAARSEPSLYHHISHRGQTNR